MRFAFLVVLLPALGGGGNDAEKLFREVEKKITSAKSLRVASESTKQKGGKDLKYTGSLDLSGPKFRIKLSSPVDFDGKTIEGKLEVVSDGKKVVVVTPVGNVQEAPPKQAHDRITKVVSRVGMGGLELAFQKAPKGQGADEPNPDKLVAARDFKLGKAVRVGGRDTKVLHYQLDLVDQKEKAVVTLWVDARSLLPVKRVIELGKDKTRVVETYTEFRLNPKLDAKTFELPRP